jgi:hypothetical protein
VLERAKVVTVPRVPFPELDRMGLPELLPMQRMQFAGITFLDTYFLQEDEVSESLHFHELVHVVQWGRLGADRFLLAYGVGLVQFGYERSPLEAMAYSLQRRFESGTLPQDLVGMIETHSETTWQSAASMLTAGSGA